MRRLITLTLTLFLAVPLLFAEGSDGQDVNETAGITQELMRFAGNIHQFNSIFPQEKVYLQFDNTSYYTGETIWFKAFVVNASTLKRAQSSVLYVDLISPTGVLLKQQKLKVVAGQADGSFVLVDGATEQSREKAGILNYPSGFYEIRAYTSYMLNFDEETIFSRVFAVYEKPKKDGNYFEAPPVIRDRWEKTTEEIRPETEKLSRINCEFYPEGGHILMGKPCRVAFKVTDETGFGIDADGVLDGTGITFSTIHDGMGLFTFTPTARRNSVTISADGKSKSFTLPGAEQSGLVLQVDATQTDDIQLHIDCTQELAGRTLGLALTCRGELFDFFTIETSSQPAEKTLSMKGIPEGVCRFYVFGTDGSIYASRSVYHHSGEITRPQIEVHADKDRYEPFEKVALRFNLRDGRGNPFRDRFCLSVRDTRSQANILADDLRTSMLLSSDLKGFIENPSWYFDSPEPEREAALDLLMLVQGWERYDWQTMTGQKEFRERHRIEESLTVNGWVMNSSGKKALDSIEVVAALMPADKTLSETYSYKTDTSGYFGFDIGAEFYDKAKFSIRAQPKRKRLIGPDARIVFDRSLSPAIRAYQPQELIFTGLLSGSKKKGKKDETTLQEDLETVISQDKGVVLPEVEIDEERMYVDYFTYTAYDVVKDVEVELDKGDYSTDLYGYLIDKGYDVYLETKPGQDGEIVTALYINGYDPFFYVHDNSQYKYTGVFDEDLLARLSIDSRDIKSILIFDRPMYLMDIYKQCPFYMEHLNKTLQSIDYGAASSKRMMLIDIQVKEPRELSTRDEIFNINKRITTIDGYSRPYAFYSPEYPDGPIPGDVDYRRTLYWNPNVVTDSTGTAQVEFYNNSYSTRFNISGAGITASGVPYILNQNW